MMLARLVAIAAALALPAIMFGGCEQNASDSPPATASSDVSDGDSAGRTEEAPRSGTGDGDQSSDGGGDDAGRRTLGPELTEIFRLIARNEFDAARARLEPYLQANPDDGQAAFLLGLSYHREYRYGAARPHFERALELAPEYHPIHHFAGWCHYYLGELDPAREAFERHLELMPTEGDSHYGLGLIAQQAGDLDEAEARFRRAIELQQNLPHRRGSRANAHVGLAEVHRRRGDLEAAERELRIAIELFPNHDEAWFQLYRVLTRLDRPDDAADALAQHEAITSAQNPAPNPSPSPSP